MKVGILIPTFNRLELLKEALCSAQEQSHENLSILVIDDGPEDNIADFMRHVADSRVSYVRNARNLGLAGSINRGIRLLEPEVSWCTILCDDDLLSVDFVARCLDSVAASGIVRIIDGQRIFIDLEGNVIRPAAPSPPEETAADYIRSRALGSRETYLTGVFFSRFGFEEIGGYPVFRTGFAADDAFIYALSHGDRLVHKDNATAFIRIHTDAESQTCICSRMPDILATMDQFRDYLIKMEPETRHLDIETDKRFKKIVDFYCAIIASSFWIQTLHGIIDNTEAGWKDEVVLLAKLAASRKDRFTFRVRLDAWMALYLGFSPETFKIYRSLWKLVIRLYKSIAK